MQEAIRAARRDNKTVEQVLADLHAQASKRVAGEAEAVTEAEAAEAEELEVERVILESEEAPVATKPHILFEEPQSSKGGDFEFPSDRLSSFEIDALKKDLIAKGIPPAEIDTIIEQAKELPRDLVEELVRSITRD
jgi:hypothetical protein